MQQEQTQVNRKIELVSSKDKTQGRKKLKQYLGSLGLLIVIVAFGIVLSFMSPVFLTKTNLINLLMQSTILVTLALGVTFVIITGGIDLSVGAIMAVSSALGLGLIVYNGVPVIVGVFIMVLIGAVFGLINGLFITKLQLSPLIVTLGTMGIARGIVLIYTNSANIDPVPDSFVSLATGSLFSIPYLILLVAVFAIIAHIILKNTVFGRSVYASGGNELAARLSGVRTKTIITLTYVISGVTAAIGGLLLSARLESVGPTAGTGLELTVIAAVVIGGTSLFGGQGNILGTILGVILISLVSNAINLLSVPPAWDSLVQGSVILVAALLDVYRRKFLKSA
ncbi:ribose ABC transporter permease [Bacillus sp. AFS076308]|uniref:ABC transporter permease n=1 Tax=unclassified Bacillus (in: firmicutes) TaxID=185979 RepID=UPI000BF58509|nr:MULTISPECIES: ABC transporter permease [unclassified Bacillus (in: firmicutes)]PFN99579.1 ribose ABC transporter permease [Bacillus sp. AFS076308]PGV50249.1 ribose ABC transporter permease [Bacillus sp. AFS037270]